MNPPRMHVLYLDPHTPCSRTSYFTAPQGKFCSTGSEACHAELRRHHGSATFFAPGWNWEHLSSFVGLLHQINLRYIHWVRWTVRCGWQKVYKERYCCCEGRSGSNDVRSHEKNKTTSIHCGLVCPASFKCIKFSQVVDSCTTYCAVHVHIRTAVHMHTTCWVTCNGHQILSRIIFFRTRITIFYLFSRGRASILFAVGNATDRCR